MIGDDFLDQDRGIHLHLYLSARSKSLFGIVRIVKMNKATINANEINKYTL